MLLVCLALIDATQNDGAASPGLAGETVRFIRAKPCGQTIRYKIGTIDKRFGIDERRVMAAAAQAAELWNAAAGAKLVEYNGAGSVAVELVYDARQSSVQRYDDRAVIIKRQEARAELIEEEAASLLSQMDVANAALSAEQGDLGIRRDDYNTRVERLNDIGGGTRGQVRALDQIKLQLAGQESDLKEKIEDLNKLNARRNELVKEHGALAGQINEMVASANRDFGDMVTGLYTKSGNRATIEIFAFADQPELVAILAHEFGHALGLGHSREPDSIMGRLRKYDAIAVGSPTSPPHLGEADIAALASVCAAR
jgi:hypothetical protein